MEGNISTGSGGEDIVIFGDIILPPSTDQQVSRVTKGPVQVSGVCLVPESANWQDLGLSRYYSQSVSAQVYCRVLLISGCTLKPVSWSDHRAPVLHFLMSITKMTENYCSFLVVLVRRANWSVTPIRARGWYLMLVYLFFVPVCVGCTWPFAVYEERSKLADFELV